MTINYYDKNAKQYFDNTINVSLGSIINRFLQYLPAKSNILDAGCGSGRDSNVFSAKGCHVVAFDASIELCKLARKHSNIEVINCTFNEFKSLILFDGIWACASLLHVPRNELSSTFISLTNQLKENGYLYCSFKYGDIQIHQDSRLYNNLTLESLTKYLPSSLIVKDTWLSEDKTNLNRKQKWLNVILYKTNNNKHNH